MTESQKHGFIFEDIIKDILGVKELAYNYTQKWDIPHKTPISVKFMGMKNALEFGSAVRIWEINKSFTLIIGRYEQIGNNKVIRSIDEINITPSILKKMRGDITLEEIKDLDNKIKRFPKGPEGQKEGSLFGRNWKKDRKDKMGLLTITIKLDSKGQRRIQCNLNKTNYAKLFEKPSMETVFRNIEIPNNIESDVRIRNKKIK